MADTLTTLVHNKGIPKLIETNNFLIINGTIYDKGSFMPTKQVFKLDFDIGLNILHISKSMHLTDSARIGSRSKESIIWADIYEENVTYCIVNNHYSDKNNAYSYLLKLKETDDDVIVEKQFSLQNIEIKEILSVTNTYIFVSSINVSNSEKNVFCIKKSDFTNAATASDGFGERNTTLRGDISKFHEDDTFLYLVAGGYNRRYFSGGFGPYYQTTMGITYYRINKITLEINTHHIERLDGNDGGGRCFEDSIRICKNINNIFYFITFRNNSSNIMKCSFDINKEFSNWFNFGYLDEKSANILYTEGNYKQIIHFIKDDKLFYCIADETNAAGSILTYQGIHKFDILDNFNIKYNERINPRKDVRITSFLFNEDYSKIIIGYYESFDILTYNDQKMSYEKIGKSYNNIKNVGLDALNRLWYETISGEIHTENFDDPQEVEVKFEKPYYSYGKTPIHTYLTFNARSSTGAIPSGRYTLTITSKNAYFEETEDNVLYIDYNNVSQDDIHYPVVITAAKRVVCSISFEKVW